MANFALCKEKRIEAASSTVVQATKLAWYVNISSIAKQSVGNPCLDLPAMNVRMKEMNKPLKNTILLFSIVFLLSCSINGASISPPKDIESKESGMIFGHIKAPERVTEVVIRRYGKIYIRPFNRPPRVLVYKNGDFMAENLEPGDYVLAAVVTAGDRYNLIQSKNDAYQDIFTVPPGGIKYIGSYRLFEFRPEDGRREKFEVIRLRKPDEREVVKNLYHKSKNTGWQTLFNKRLMELR